jgi:hypothetical protein
LFKYIIHNSIPKKILQSKSIKFYDIENINYNYIENLYNKKIPEEVINKNHGHERSNIIKKINKNIILEKDKYLDTFVFDLNIEDYINYNIDIKYFYNEEIKNKLFNFYKDDFIFFSENGINYINSSF